MLTIKSDYSMAVWKDRREAMHGSKWKFAVLALFVLIFIVLIQLLIIVSSIDAVLAVLVIIVILLLLPIAVFVMDYYLACNM